MSRPTNVPDVDTALLTIAKREFLIDTPAMRKALRGAYDLGAKGKADLLHIVNEERTSIQARVVPGGVPISFGRPLTKYENARCLRITTAIEEAS